LVRRIAVNKRVPRNLEAKAVDALIADQNMPPAPEQIEALQKARRLRQAAETYNYLFSCESKPAA
jgi:hypothetical protein